MKTSLKILFIILSITINNFAEYIDSKSLWKNDNPDYLDCLHNILSKKNLLGYDALVKASEQGKYNIASALIENGANVNAKDSTYQSPLH